MVAKLHCTAFVVIFNTLALLTICCNDTEHTAKNSVTDSLTAESIASEVKPKTTEMDCDTVYKNKAYKITLEIFDTSIEDETMFNSIFKLSKFINGHLAPIFSDSIFSKVQEVRFDDFNNDGVKDILVQNLSDVRSNWTYYLYLVDTAHDKLTKIKGFEEIKNPNYISKYNLIDNYVVSGENWTSFYKIQGDTIKDYGIVIYDDQKGDGSFDYQYKKAIKKVLAEESDR